MAIRNLVLNLGSGSDVQAVSGHILINRHTAGSTDAGLWIFDSPERVVLTNPARTVPLEVGVAYKFDPVIPEGTTIYAYMTAGAGDLNYLNLVPVDPSTLLPSPAPEAAWWATADANVVDGAVVGDDLILTRYNGATFNAGRVTGALSDSDIAALVPGPSATQAALNDRFGVKGKTADAFVFVSPTGSDSNDGLSPGAAKLTIAAAANSLPAAGGTVNILAGTFTLTTPLPNRSGITYRGVNRGASRINVTVGSLLAPTLFDVNGLVFEGLLIIGYADHLFKFTGSGGIYQSVFKDCTFVSTVAGSSVFHSRSGSFQENLFFNCIIDRPGTATVPTVDVINSIGAANANVFSRLTMHSVNCTSSPAIRFEASGDQTYANDNAFLDVVGEQNAGGLIHVYSAKGTRIEGCIDWDTTVNYAADVIRIGKSATNALISYDTFVVNSGRRGGTLGAGVYDYSGPPAVSRNSTLINVGNSSNSPVIQGGDIVTNVNGLVIADYSWLQIASKGVSSIKPTFASVDGLLLQDGVASYTAKLLAFRTFTSTENRAAISGAGTFSWGSGVAALDTTLYRASAGVLQAGQKLTAVGGLGVGNSVAATSPGTVTKKIEIFDSAGASLGFIPVYGSIA